MTTMEDLTKTQIVLLTLLVSFITSIATGIITTSLLAEAPQNVTQTIDRVVERTIERVSPAPQDMEVVREVTVVKEGDAIVSSIEEGSQALVRIKSPQGEFYALGIVVSAKGHVLSDRRDITQDGPYTAVLADGSTLAARVVKASETGSFVLFQLEASQNELEKLSIMPLSESDPKLGQTVIAIEGRESNAIAVGRVLSLNADAGTALTDIDPVSETAGAPLISLTGELVGLKTSNSDLSLPASAYTTVAPLAKFIADNS